MNPKKGTTMEPLGKPYALPESPSAPERHKASGMHGHMEHFREQSAAASDEGPRVQGFRA